MGRKYFEETSQRTDRDADGNVVRTEETSEIKEIKKNEEPNYIKIYTDMWCSFNEIPEKWRPLFLALACRMSYADKENSDALGGQVVYTIGNNAKVIAKECGWATLSPLYEGLKVLCNHGAIRKLSRGMYQINPSYAGKGAWRYNKKERQGGIENIITTFRFRGKSVDTVIEWDEN